MILYVPRSSVTVKRDFWISAGLLASTDTPGRTAPLWSFTTPVNVLCARVSGTNAVKYSNDTKTPMAARPVLDFLILSSPSNAYTEGLSSNGGRRRPLRSLAHPEWTSKSSEYFDIRNYFASLLRGFIKWQGCLYIRCGGYFWRKLGVSTISSVRTATRYFSFRNFAFRKYGES